MFPHKNALVALFFLVVPGCGNSSTPQPDGADSGQSGYCTSDPSAKAFHVGMSDTGANGYVFELVDATPILPAQGVSDGNSWTLKISNASGPVDGGTLSAKCLMVMPGGAPSHGCAGGDPHVAPLGNGEYQVSRIFFNMPGHWDMKFSIEDGSTTDAATIGTCIDQ